MTDDDLRARLAKALIARIKASVLIDPVKQPGTVGQPLAATEYDLADTVLAVLAADPGDLPKGMAEAIDETWTSEEDFDAQKAAAAAMGVRDEQMAHLTARADKAEAEVERLADFGIGHRERAEAAAAQVAALQRELTEVKAERDTNFSVLQRVSKGGWETATELVNERIARKQAERELTDAKQAVYNARATHVREAHPTRLIAGECYFCRIFVAIDRDMPSRPDDPEEIRRLAESTETET